MKGNKRWKYSVLFVGLKSLGDLLEVLHDLKMKLREFNLSRDLVGAQRLIVLCRIRTLQITKS